MTRRTRPGHPARRAPRGAAGAVPPPGDAAGPAPGAARPTASRAAVAGPPPRVRRRGGRARPLRATAARRDGRWDRPDPRSRRESGSASIEFLGFLPVLILVALAAVQLGIAAYAVQQAGTAARAAARMGSLDEPGTSPDAAGKAAISGWLADEATISGGDCGGDEASATASVKIPSVIPGFDIFGSAERSATMPCDEGSLQAAGGGS